MVATDRDGQHPMYRERNWQKEERRKQKKKRKTSWLTKGGYGTVIEVAPTPGGELAKRFQNVVDRNPGPIKIKIQETGGIQVKNKLKNESWQGEWL